MPGPSSIPGETFSHWPGHPAPLPLDLLPGAAHACSYFPDRLCRTRAFWVEELPGAWYHRFMDAGFRRSGNVIYQPVCPGCRDCIPLRVPVESFGASKSQKRCRRRNEDLRVTVARPQATIEKHEVYERYRRQWHGGSEREDWETFVSFLYASPVETLEFCYREPGGRLVGVGLCDVCALSLSSVYFYFDPEFARRSPGTFSALREIEWAAQQGIAHYYLGYWIEGCGAMRYKSSFRPCEILGTDGVWRRL